MRFGRACIWALVVLAAACTPKSKGGREKEQTVATVGTHTITKTYFEDRLEKMDRALIPDTLDLAGKRKFLEYIVNKEVLALKAEEMGYANDPDVKAQYAMIEEQLLQGRSVELAIADKLAVSDEEVQRFYDNSMRKVLCKHIVVGSREEADALLAQLRAGANFDSMVDVHSTVPRVDETGAGVPLQRRAIFGELTYGRATPAVEKAIFETPIGQVAAEPVQTPYGWHIFMPVSESAVKQRPLDEERDRIVQQLKARKRREATNDYYESILVKHNFSMQPTATDLIFQKLPPDSDQPIDPGSEVKPVINFTYEEREMTFFEVDGKKYTVGDFSDRYDQTSYPERPRKWVGTQGLRYWVRDAWLKPLQIEQARKDGVDQRPEVVNELKTRHEMLMVGQLHNNLIAQQVPEPSDEEVRKFFTDHATAYVEKEKRVCNLVFHPREAVVRRAYDEVVAGADFVTTAIKYNDYATEAKDVQTAAFSRDDEKHQELADSAFARDLKQYSMPFKTSQGWIALQVQQIIPERPFALEDIRDNVVEDWKTQWSENKLNELLAEWKKSYPIKVDDKVLASTAVRRNDVFVPGKTAPGGTQ